MSKILVSYLQASFFFYWLCILYPNLDIIKGKEKMSRIHSLLSAEAHLEFPLKILCPWSHHYLVESKNHSPVTNCKFPSSRFKRRVSNLINIKGWIPTCITEHSASTKNHYFSSSRTQYKCRLMLKDRQKESLTCILELVLREEIHMKPLHTL